MYRLRQSSSLSFFGRLKPDTGEIKDRLTAEHRGLCITLFGSGLVEVQGSLHKYANNGHHNHDAFGYERLTQTIEEISQLLNTPPTAMELHNVEIGVNILPPIAPSVVLDSTLHYRYHLSDVRTFGGAGYLKQWVYQNYVFKL